MKINRNIIPYIVLTLGLTVLFLYVKYEWLGVPPVEQTNEKESMDTNEKSRVVLIDVRTEQEYAAKHRPGAINLPVNVIDKLIEAEVPDKNTPIVLYCRSGRRAAEAKNILELLGYKHVENAHDWTDNSASK